MDRNNLIKKGLVVAVILLFFSAALGTYTLTITAEDSFGAIGGAEMKVWNFCFIP